MWIDFTNYISSIYYKNTHFNGILLTNKRGLYNIVKDFESIFSNFTDYSSEMTSIYYCPIKSIKVSNTSQHLNNSRGDWNDVKVKQIEEGSTIQHLGQYFVRPRFNNFADYKGYTHIKIYLPYMGYVNVDPNECMGKYLQFFVAFDFATGKGVYLIGTSSNYIDNQHEPYIEDHSFDDVRIISTYEFDFAMEIPVGTSNIGDIKRNAVLGAIKTVATAAVSAATMGVPAAVVATTSSVTSSFEVQERSPDKGSRLKTTSAGTETQTTETTKTTNNPKSFSKTALEAFNSSIGVLNMSAPNGNTDRVNDASLLWSLPTNIIVEIYRPKMMNYSKNEISLLGQPVGVANPISFMKGFMVASSVKIPDISSSSSITLEELEELEMLLTSPNGFYRYTVEEDDVYTNLKSFELYFYKDHYQWLPQYKFYYPHEYMTWKNFIDSPYNVGNLFVYDDWSDYVRLNIKDDYDEYYYLENIVGTLVNKNSTVYNSNNPDYGYGFY